MDPRREALLAGLVATVVASAPVTAFSQVIGEEAEMERLQARAEEAIANGDAEGAAMTMGRAALMAAHLAKRQEDARRAQWYRGAEQLFRAEEQGYRAQALFIRAGGEIPASSGVCGSMALAHHHLDKAMALLVDADPVPGRLQHLHATATDWGKILEGLQADFQCP